MSTNTRKRPILAELVSIGRTGKRQKQLAGSNDISALLPVVRSVFDDNDENINSFWESGNALVGATVIHHNNTKELLSRSHQMFNRLHYLTPEAENRADYDRQVLDNFYRHQKSQFHHSIRNSHQQPPSSPPLRAVPLETTGEHTPEQNQLGSVTGNDPVQFSFLNELGDQNVGIVAEGNEFTPGAVEPNPIRIPYFPLSSSLSEAAEEPVIIHQNQEIANPNEPFDFNDERLLREYEHAEARNSTINLLNRLTVASDPILEPLEEHLFVRSSGPSSLVADDDGNNYIENNAESIAGVSIGDGNSVGGRSTGTSSNSVDTSPARILLNPVEMPQTVRTRPEYEVSPLRALTRRLIQRTNETNTGDLSIVEWSPLPEKPPSIRAQRSVVDERPFESYLENSDQDWLIQNYLDKRPRRKRKQKPRPASYTAFNQDYRLGPENHYHLWGPVAIHNSKELEEAQLDTSEVLGDVLEVGNTLELNDSLEMNAALEMSEIAPYIEMSDNFTNGVELPNTHDEGIQIDIPPTENRGRQEAVFHDGPEAINSPGLASIGIGNSGDTRREVVGETDGINRARANSFVNGAVPSTEGNTPLALNASTNRHETILLNSITGDSSTGAFSDSWNETGLFKNAPKSEFNSFDRLPRMLAAGSMVSHPHPYDHDPLSDVRELASEEVTAWHQANEERLSEDFFQDLTGFIARTLETSMRISFENFYRAVSRAHHGKIQQHLYLYALTFIAQQKVVELTQRVHTQLGAHSQIIIERLV